MRYERALVGFLCITAVAVAGCGGQLAYNLPPADRLMEPGPGVGGPGPGVIPPAGSPYGMYGGAVGRFGDGPGGYGGGHGSGCGCATNQPSSTGGNGPMMAAGGYGADGGVVQAGYYGDCGCGNAGCGCADGCEGGSCSIGGCSGGCSACPCGGAGCALCGGLRGMMGPRMRCGPGSTEAYASGGPVMAPATSQVAFLGEEGVQVSWDVGGSNMFDSLPLVIPGRQDFYQAAVYRLKITNLPGRPAVELYPTLEIAPVTPRTDAYLAHAPIPVQFTEEDFDQVLSGNFVTKVIYLPDPEFQELALAGVETLVSTRLDPGVDPIAEADRRGSILAILRMGNKDLESISVDSGEPEQMIPAGHVSQASYYGGAGVANRAVYDESMGAAGQPMGGGVMPAQCNSGCNDGGYGGGYYGGGAEVNMPTGMPTSGFAPPTMPPSMMAGGPQWGMPITGTPIGLPGPPHVPLGVPAGLRKHVVKNRTRVVLPPPVSKVQVSVKQRPGLNYPNPVNKVYIDETQREPVRLVPSWVSGLFSGGRSGANGPDCQ